MQNTQLSAGLLRSRLCEAGFDIPPPQLCLEQREDRWLVQWGRDELAWFAASAEAAGRMAVERNVLALVQNQCSFPAPAILHAAPDGSFDIRTRLPGIVDPALVHERLRNDAGAALQLGRWIGSVLAELHAAIRPGLVPEWLPRQVNWPEPANWIRERLPAVISDKFMLSEMHSLLDDYENLQTAADDLVLAHTDLGLHNIVFAADSLAPCGLIDFEAAAYVDRHCDFRYLILDFADTMLLTTACDTYQENTGRQLQPARILLYNAACACCYLANRAGVAPETRWCGRTLAEDIAWTTAALERLRNNRSKYF